MRYKISRQSISFSHYYLSLFFIGIFAFLMFASPVQATTPTLTLSPTGDGDTVNVNVTGDPSTSVILYYMKTNYGQQINPIGTTNANGILATTISTSTYGIVANSSVYITMGSLNGPQSATVSWPIASALISSSNMLSLSQTGVVLSLGQSSTITASNMNSSSLYLSNNSTPAIANVNISGSQITILANSYGSTVATICLVNNSSNCSSVYITVQNSSAQPLTFSQNTVSMYSGQSISVQISGGSGTYSVFNNTSQNGGVVQTSISGSNITLTTTSTSGSSSITVCSTNMSSCGIINVTIGSGSSTAISFSQSNPTVVIGQTTNVSVYGPTSSLFYVSSNSNPSIVQANLSGTTLTLMGITNGSSTISVCSSSSNCGSLTVTVNYSSTNGGGYPVLSQDNVSLAVGQTLNITISGGSMPYNILSTTNNIFQPTLNVNMLSIYGLGAGSGAMNVCSSGGNCATLSVTVGNSSSAVTTLPVGCYTTTGYSQTTGVLCNSTTTPATTIIPTGCTSSTLFSTITGQSCPNYVYTSTTATTTTNTTTSSTTTTFKFTLPLKLGSSGTEVIELQKKLKTLGYYNGKVDGGFGPMMVKAVKAFQKAHKLAQLGSVGPGTRALLNK